MPKLTVDGIEVEVPAGATVLQACEAAGKEIPRFCYHERLSIAGNCRMCLVEVKPGPPKPQASCALPAADNQEIRTDSAMVKAAREGVMEFLLINHPLDCPICDQGGECDLQDQSVAYGRGHSRYTENKRAVTEKYMGPIVKTVMTRCIQCTRCIRFAEEVAGVEDIGAIYRGEAMQITSYLENAVPVRTVGQRRRSLPGRRADVEALCVRGAAVGAEEDAGDRRDGRGRHQHPARQPRAPGAARAAADQRGRQRGVGARQDPPRTSTGWCGGGSTSPMSARTASWSRRAGDEAFDAIAAVAKAAGSSVAAVHGDMVDCETIYATKALLTALGSTLHEGRQTGASYDTSSLAAVNFNTTIAGIEQADAILLVGTNVRWEASLVNTRIRKAVKKRREGLRDRARDRADL